MLSRLMSKGTRSPRRSSSSSRYTSTCAMVLYPLITPSEHVDTDDRVCVGERTPVRIRMSDPPASIPEGWMLCHTARRFSAAVASNSTDGSQEGLPLRKVVEREDGSIASGEW